MTKILVLDVDANHNKKIEVTLGQAADTQVLFFADPTHMLEVLNGFPSLEQKKSDAQKLVSETDALIKKALDAEVQTQKKITELKAKSVADPKEAPTNADKIKELDGQIAQNLEMRKKLEEIIAKKKAEIGDLEAKSLKPDEKKVNLVIIDRSFLGNQVGPWMVDFRGKIQFADNKEVPVVIMGYNDNIDYIKQTMVGGVSDYFVKPTDVLLLKHNLLKISGKKLESGDKIYELQAKSDIKFLRVAGVTKISEFEITVSTNSPISVNEVVEFYADQFSANKNARILGRCLSCDPDQVQKGFLVLHFSLVGLSPQTMNEMRKWLKLQYIAQKNAEGG